VAGAYGAKLLPVDKRNPLVRQSAASFMGERSGGGKVKGTDESNGWVGKRDNVGPGYILVGRRLVVGSE
jgi:hypothetical protein